MGGKITYLLKSDLAVLMREAFLTFSKNRPLKYSDFDHTSHHDDMSMYKEAACTDDFTDYEKNIFLSSDTQIFWKNITFNNKNKEKKFRRYFLLLFILLKIVKLFLNVL